MSQAPTPGQLILELNFCQKGTDHAFQIEIDATKSYLELWDKITHHVLIPIESFALEHDGADGKTKRVRVAQQSYYQPLWKFGQMFSESAIITYSDDRFAPISDQERQWLLSRPGYENYGRIAISRPPLFIAALAKYPEIQTQLQPPLSELYTPQDQLDVNSDEFLHLLSRFVLPLAHRKTYWNQSKTDSTTENHIVKEELRHIEGTEIMQEQFQFAMEYTPEHFGSVDMLYVPFEINEQKVACFVDSGAQTTLISLSFAKRAGIDHLIDRQFAGKARGVGSGDILGSIHAVKVKLGSQHLSLRFQVLTSIDLDVLLGLDNLKGHQMKINLEQNILECGNDKIKFLSEHEIREYQRQSLRAKLEFNEKNASGNKLKLTDEDEHMLTKQKRQEENSGKVNGSPGTTMADFFTFANENIHDIQRALKHVSDRYEFDIVQKQRLGNTTLRADQKIIQHFTTPLPVEQIAQRAGLVRPAGKSASRAAAGGRLGTNGAAPAPGPVQTKAMQDFLSLMAQAMGRADVATAATAAVPTPAANGPAPPGPPSTAVAPASSPGASPTPVDEEPQPPQLQVDAEKLQKLIDLGHDRDEATQVLALYENDLELALAALEPED